MGTKHYPQEYRERLIALARSGRSVASFAEEFEPMPQTIRNCLVRADTDDAVPRANPLNGGAGHPGSKKFVTTNQRIKAVSLMRRHSAKGFSAQCS